MAKILAPAEKGEARLSHYTVDRNVSALSALRPGMYTPEGTYVQLHVGNVLMMSDTRHEKITNYEVVHQAKGRVLIAGLGVGMIIHPIAAKEEVDSIVILEKSRDVIDLVAPSLPGGKKITVIQGDVLEIIPPKELRYDTIYFDIWPSITTENLPEINMLHRRWRSRLSTGGWMDSWCRDQLRSQQRRERKEERERERWFR